MTRGEEEQVHPPMAVVQERRFAVVMYGGVSLAIYINGVVQELLRMVRATAPDQSGNRALLADSQLDGTEKIYRRLAQSLGAGRLARDIRPESPIRVRFVVDILSGTSAGGINSIFLAKALAHNQSIENLRKLWIQEGDIQVLINDKKSTKNTKLRPQRPPKSLLNSRRMYEKLMVAFEGMQTESGEPSEALVKEIDLFVTTTDITGLPIELQLADRVVGERKHRQVFHFTYRDRERYGEIGARDDFVSDNDPFLAFAARCTSSFPFAFEPMRLVDIDGAGAGLDKRWEKFYAEYVATSARDGAVDFTERAFGDGGYLDNKPFSYAIDAIGTRAPQAPTDRSLIYIEPNPAAAPSGEGETPNALENTSAALSLARYETIREDLQRILDRNQVLERVDRILCGTEEDIARREQTRKWDVTKWLESPLDQMIEQKGISYGSYLRLRVELLTEDLSRLVIANSNWDPLSDESRAIATLVRAWRDDRFTYYSDQGTESETFHRFLLDYDLSFYIRRLEFVLRKANEMLPMGRRAHTCLAHAKCEEILESENDRKAFLEGIFASRAELARALLDLRQRWDRLFERDPEGEVGRIVSTMQLDRGRLLKVLEEQRESAASEASSKRTTAKRMLDGARERIEDLAEVLQKNVEAALSTVNQSKEVAGFSRQGRAWDFDPEPPADPSAKGAWVLGFYMYRFSLYDLVTLPILYATGVRDEHDSVEVIRISPRDAKALIDEEDEAEPRRKLGGTALANFGAFLDRGWRENDILWGRLDGAERLIHAMVPADEVDLRDTWIEEAQEEILRQFSEVKAESAVAQLTETLTRFEPQGESAQERHAHLKELVAARSQPVPSAERTITDSLIGALDPRSLRDFFKRSYEVYREPDRKTAVESLARATQVTGQILEDIADDYSVGKKPAAWVTRLGRMFWGLVEISVPRGFWTILASHWLWLLFMFALLMIGGGVLFGESGVRNVGWGALGVLVVVGTARLLLGDYLRHRGGFLGLLKTAAVVGGLALLANGALYVPARLERWRTWLVGNWPELRGVLDWLSERLP